MISNTIQSNKRIAKNTGMLYFRMFFMMAISLYTSRVVLATLGLVDFGLYNVIGGVVTMFTVINFAMTCASARFITFNLGKGDVDKLNKVFSTSVVIHIIIAIIILLLAETIGLWFLKNKLVIPENRIEAAHWVYQFSVLSCMVMIMSVPYNALITSHEKMGAFAYISILEAALKLLIVYLLVVGGFDKLVLYAILMFAVQLIIRIIYQLYCIRTFREVKFKFIWDKVIQKEMFGYAMWSLVGSAANIFATQGQNILLNMFFGPAVNAARGVAVQVQNAIQQFSTNFQSAMSPQINKSYARGDLKYMHSLLNASSKYSYYLLFILSLPVYFEVETLLGWWLVEIPEHTIAFIRLMLIISVLTALGNPISSAAGATGRIRNSQLIVGGIMCLIVPASYFVLKINAVPEYIFIVQILVAIMGQIARLIIVRPLIGFSLKRYFNEVVITSLKVTILSIIIPYIVYANMGKGLVSFLVVCIVCILSVLISIYLIGLKKTEKEMIKAQVVKFYNRICHK